MQHAVPYRMKCLLLVVVCGVFWCVVAAHAQQAGTPSWQPRASDDGPTQTVSPAAGQKKTTSGEPNVSTLPQDVSGAYAFDHNGESIEIDIDRNKLSGYIARLGDAETDNNTPLTYFFDHSKVDGDQLQFETKVVHGVWYSFTGTIVRGNGETRDQAGYYLLRGKLLVHHPRDERDKTSEETVEQRTVSYKSIAQ